MIWHQILEQNKYAKEQSRHEIWDYLGAETRIKLMQLGNNPQHLL